MSPLIIESLDVAVRWLHVTAAVVWIGSSFYFIRLDYGLRDGANLPKGAQGDVWAAHGGGFYQMIKFLTSPQNLPNDLKWTRWESYITFVSGFALLIIVYYCDADLFLIDRSVLDITPWQAGAISVFGLVLAWLGYHSLCRSPLGKHDMVLALVGYIFFVGLTYAFTYVFSGRGALNEIGAIIGTIMVANAFLVIHPTQQRAIEALKKGRQPHTELGRQAGQRSVHNNYLALPVLFLMISNHYPQIYATRFNWLIVAIVLALGPAMRHYFNKRHAGNGNAWWVWGAVALAAGVVAWLTMFGPRDRLGRAEGINPTFMQVEGIVTARCSMCHAKKPTWPTIAVAPAGIELDDPDSILRDARLIERSTVRSNSMPPGNVTEMSVDERRAIAGWVSGGSGR